MVTRRMLAMYKKKEKPRPSGSEAAGQKNEKKGAE